MTREEAIEKIKEVQIIIRTQHMCKSMDDGCTAEEVEDYKARFEALTMATKALKLTSVKECSTCLDKGCCAIFDNFNIDYCSDYRGGIND